MGDKDETEVKLYVGDLAPLAERLVAAGAVLEHPRTYEHNIRYDTPAGDLSRQYIVLRLRRDTRARLTYKGPASISEGIMSRFEAEVTVDDFETMDGILRALGYVPFVIYEKYRTTYRLGEVEVVLDEMPFGNFCEIEGPRAAIVAALEALGLAEHPRIGTSYLGMFAQLKQMLHLPFRDLTFANFAGIVIPPEVFDRLT
jgi:adenylate cyclase class 2